MSMKQYFNDISALIRFNFFCFDLSIHHIWFNKKYNEDTVRMQSWDKYKDNGLQNERDGANDLISYCIHE